MRPFLANTSPGVYRANENANMTEEQYDTVSAMKDKLEEAYQNGTLNVEGQRAMLQAKIMLGEGLSDGEVALL